MINESLLKNEELAVYALRDLYSGFGYSQFKMSKFEEYDLYVKNKDFLISDRIITFTDTNGKLLALKPDVTLSIINNYAGNREGVQKLYYSENVYRVSGTNGRFKEIMQTGLECIGKIGIYEIAEVVYLAIKSLSLIDGDFSLELSHSALLNSLLADADIDAAVMPYVLNAIRVKSTGLPEELLSNNKITENQSELLKVLISDYADAVSFKNAVREFIISDESKKNFDEFLSLFDAVYSEEINGKLTVNFSIASEAGYYSGIVFKGYINGIPVSVLSGGQYDTLMKKFGEDAGAVGFAVYLDSFERFKTEASQYDIDTVLLVKEKAAPKDILKKAENLKSEGERVLVLTKIPENLRYRRIVIMEG